MKRILEENGYTNRRDGNSFPNVKSSRQNIQLSSVYNTRTQVQHNTNGLKLMEWPPVSDKMINREPPLST